MAVMGLRLNGSLYTILGVLFVLRGALQGLGRTLIPTTTGVIELAMRLGTAVILAPALGYTGIIWGTPLAWTGAVLLLVPTYVLAHRRLRATPLDPSAAATTPREPVAFPTASSQPCVRTSQSHPPCLTRPR
jgi:Na+-driven multidrug efflux pump